MTDEDLAAIKARCDTHFIAHARTDVPALVAEVERLRAEIDALQEFKADRTALVLKYEEAQREITALKSKIDVGQKHELYLAELVVDRAWRIEVTEAMVERACDAYIEALHGKNDFRLFMRAAIEAALNPEGKP